MTFYRHIEGHYIKHSTKIRVIRVRQFVNEEKKLYDAIFLATCNAVLKFGFAFILRIKGTIL